MKCLGIAWHLGIGGAHDSTHPNRRGRTARSRGGTNLFGVWRCFGRMGSHFSVRWQRRYRRTTRTTYLVSGRKVVVYHLSRGPFTVLSCLRPIYLLCSVDASPFQGSAGAREQAGGRRRRKHDLHDQLPRAAQGGQERHARIYRQKAVPGAGVREARLRQVSKAQYATKAGAGQSLVLSAVSSSPCTSTPLFKAIYSKVVKKK